jgi:hypothetical protein
MQNKSIRGSKQGLSPKEEDHLHTECKASPSEGQNKVLHQRKVITYFLRAEKDHQKVIMGVFTKRRWSLTYWVQNKTIRGSEQGFALKKGTYTLSAKQDH